MLDIRNCDNMDDKTKDNQEPFKKFSENLHQLRIFKRLSQKDASKEMRLRNCSRYETLEAGRGVPSIQEVMSIAKYYSCSIDDLLYKKAVIPILEFTD